MLPTTALRFHDITHLTARSVGSLGAPLTLEFSGPHGDVELILFLNDHVLVERLVAAISDITRNWKPE
jgi:hypothetical protein